MVIHTVQPNETIVTIAETYGVSAESIILNNQLINPDRLVIGQTLLVLFPEETYQVKEADNLTDIAAAHGLSAIELLRNNLQLFGREYIFPGEELVIRYSDEKIMALSTNGYAFPFIDISLLQKTLPYLTYLTIFYYKITKDGGLIDINEKELINTAKAYGVAPIMLISTLTENRTTDMETTRSILTNLDVQDRLISRVLEVMQTKGYYGLNIDMQNITPEERQLFVDFISKMSARLKQAGFILLVTFTPNTFLTETGAFYEGPEYAMIGELIDSAMLLSYQWGNVSSPQPALPLSEVRALMEYSISQVPAEKINIGVPIIGYIWRLPFIPGSSTANAITHNSALNLALDVGAPVLHDPASEAPYFTYSLDNDYIVWFRDVRSIAAILALVAEYGLEGIGTWNIMQFASGLWLLINALFDIRKV
mgnify:CR=1 FL=1